MISLRVGYLQQPPYPTHYPTPHFKLNYINNASTVQNSILRACLHTIAGDGLVSVLNLCFELIIEKTHFKNHI